MKADAEMPQKPLAREPRHLIESTRLLEEVRRALNDLDPVFAMQFPGRLPIQVEHRVVARADDEEGGRRNALERFPRKLRPSTAAYHGRDAQWALCSRAQGNCRTGARTQDSDRQTLKTRLRFQPVDRLHQPVALHFDIKVRSAGKTLKLMLAPRQEIDQKRGDAVLIQDVRQLLITRVRPIAPAVMCEHHRANRVRRHGNDAGQDPARDAHDHVERAGLDRPRRRL